MTTVSPWRGAGGSYVMGAPPLVTSIRSPLASLKTVSARSASMLAISATVCTSGGIRPKSAVTTGPLTVMPSWAGWL